jgi:hypothetical protein
MPNYSYNSLSLSTKNEDDANWLIDIWENPEQGVFSRIRPLPGGQYDYELAIETWGAKWDVTSDYILSVDVQKLECGLICIDIEFDTAWDPPRGVLSELRRRGFSVHCDYEDESMGVRGVWENGYDTCHTELWDGSIKTSTTRDDDDLEDSSTVELSFDQPLRTTPSESS